MCIRDSYPGDAPDGSVVLQTLSAAQVTQLDAGCQICNTSAYPFGPGPNPNALAYFNSMPAANGSTLGDSYNTGSYSFSSPHPIRLNTTIARIAVSYTHLDVYKRQSASSACSSTNSSIAITCNIPSSPR